MSLTILVVDDHPDSVTALARLLMRDGHYVSVAGSLANALIVAAKLPAIDLLISDIGLPDGDGCQLLRLLRERTRGGPRVAIALTGHGEEEWESECRSAGFDQFLVKPITYDRLTACVARLMPQARPEPSPATGGFAFQ
jgi:CheY-like chemotaxis protein